jgi:hypothetical protein
LLGTDASESSSNATLQPVNRQLDAKIAAIGRQKFAEIPLDRLPAFCDTPRPFQPPAIAEIGQISGRTALVFARRACSVDSSSSLHYLRFASSHFRSIHIVG